MKSYHQRIRPTASIMSFKWKAVGAGAEAQFLCMNAIGWNNVQRMKRQEMKRALIASRMREDATLKKGRRWFPARIKVRDITPSLIMAISRKTAHISAWGRP